MEGVGRLNMMEHVHLAGEDEDDLYGGFNDYNATLDTDVRKPDDDFLKIKSFPYFYSLLDSVWLRSLRLYCLHTKKCGDYLSFRKLLQHDIFWRVCEMMNVKKIYFCF